MSIKLTEGAITKAAREVAASKKQRDLYDDGCRGLCIRLTPAGAKTWNLSCRDVHGAARRFPLGGFPDDLTISQARDAARSLHAKVKAGFDPTAAKAKVRQVAKDARAGIGTLAALLDQYEAEGPQRRSWPDCRRQIANVFVSLLDRPVSAIKKTELSVTAQKHPAKHAAAAAVRYIRPVLRWAAEQGDADPALFDIKPPKTEAEARTRVLSDAELAAIWKAAEAPGVPAVFGRIVRLLTLTGQRRDEVAEMDWSELSADRETWTLPGHRIKKKTTHIVPLSEAARAILPPESGKGLVFPGQRGAFGGFSKAKVALDEASGVKDWRLHDIRRTVATGLQQLGVRLEVTEACLGHVSGSRSGITGVYQLYEWAPEKKAALTAWAGRVAVIVEGKADASNVIPLRGAA